MSKKLTWSAADVARKIANMRVEGSAKPTPPVIQNQRFSAITGTRMAGGRSNPPPRKNKITLPPIWKK